MSQWGWPLTVTAFTDHCSSVLLVPILVALYLENVNPNSDWETAVSLWTASTSKVGHFRAREGVFSSKDIKQRRHSGSSARCSGSGGELPPCAGGCKQDKAVRAAAAKE